MSQMVFINLPVKDLERSKAFFAALGYSWNPEFSDETAASVVISDSIFVMLLTEEKFGTFTNKRIADTATTTEGIIALSAESREQVDELCDKALAAGGAKSMDPQDYGFMYGRSFLDVDGHHWEVFWMDQNAQM